MFNFQFDYHDLKTRNDGVVVISEQNFCEMILAYAGLGTAISKKTKKRIAKLYDNNSLVSFYGQHLLVPPKIDP